jgi:NADH:ubiquinone oxidoreductase subunit 5 (subunit L)/multisubunit Na+/H+ antiporter MnhA subunit
MNLHLYISPVIASVNLIAFFLVAGSAFAGWRRVRHVSSRNRLATRPIALVSAEVAAVLMALVNLFFYFWAKVHADFMALPPLLLVLVWFCISHAVSRIWHANERSVTPPSLD